MNEWLDDVAKEFSKVELYSCGTEFSRFPNGFDLYVTISGAHKIFTFYIFVKIFNVTILTQCDNAYLFLSVLYSLHGVFLHILAGKFLCHLYKLSVFASHVRHFFFIAVHQGAPHEVGIRGFWKTIIYVLS